MAYSGKNITKSSLAALGASLTDEAVSDTVKLWSEAGALALRVDIKASSVTAGAGITAKIQELKAGLTWADVKSVAITTNGIVSIKINGYQSDDKALVPLADQIRVVVSTTAGSAVTIDAVVVYRGH